MNDFEIEKTNKTWGQKPEQPEKGETASGIESEQNKVLGAQMLENPPDGSFVAGLRAFVTWVKTLLDDK